MKVKKILNRKQTDLNIIKPTVDQKNSENELSVNGIESIKTMTVFTSIANGPKLNTFVDEIDGHLPQLKDIPHFQRHLKRTDSHPLPPTPALKEIPVFKCNHSQNHPNVNLKQKIGLTSNPSLNESINSLKESQETEVINSNTSLLDTLTDIDEQSANNALQDLNIERQPPITSTQTTASYSPPFPVNNSNYNISHKYVNPLNESSFITTTLSKSNNNCNESITTNMTESQTLNVCRSKVNIDLSDDTNSPISISEVTSPLDNSINTSQGFRFTSFSQKCVSEQINTQRKEHQINDNLMKKHKSDSKMNTNRKPLKYMPIKPIRYCAKNYRIIGVNRHSTRVKTSVTDNADCLYDHMGNASWSEIDGSKYDCVVSKWREDDVMSEEIRKTILSKVNGMVFRKSVYSDDKGVYYSFSAFKEECSVASGLKCMMRLDYLAVKHMRFNANAITRLFLLSGQSHLNAENGKQRKNIETGHEVLIPEHTRYQLENKNVEPCYFLVIMIKPSIAFV